MTRSAVMLALATIIATTLLVGCSAIESALTPAPKVVTQEATVAVPGAKVSGDLGPDAPSVVPLWPGATVVESTLQDQTYSLSLNAEAPYRDVFTGVAAGFEKSGWSVQRDESGAAGSKTAVLTVSGNGYEGMVTVSEIASGTAEVDYVLTPAK